MMSRVLCAIACSAACAFFITTPDARASSNSSGSKAASAAKSGKAGAPSALGARSTSILGAAWKSDNSPIPGARVRLRNKLTGRIDATAVANEIGQFAFTGVEQGEFVIELVSDRGRVLALGIRLIVAPGDTIVTFVRQDTTPPPSWVDRLFKSDDSATAASQTSRAGASTGVTAMSPEEVRPVSGRQ